MLAGRSNWGFLGAHKHTNKYTNANKQTQTNKCKQTNKQKIKSKHRAELQIFKVSLLAIGPANLTYEL
jgi:hypothetical protein